MLKDYSEVVAKVKGDLIARGFSLMGPCGAFEITKRVAFALRDEGAGLLYKPTGNNCQGFAVDIIAERDGTHYDVLIKGGGAEDANGTPIPGTGNEPSWQLVSFKADPSRWAPPFQVDADQPDWPPPLPPMEWPPAPVPAPPFELVAVLKELVALRGELRELLDVMTLDRSVMLGGLEQLHAQAERGFTAKVFGQTVWFKPVPAPKPADGTR